MFSVDVKNSIREKLQKRYNQIREFSLKLTEPLVTEDMVIQSMPDCSPTKWHLAHTSWFFETFVLKAFDNDYKSLNPMYPYLFNSYYVQAGERYYRPHRGLISRPTVSEVFEFRGFIDEKMNDFFSKADDNELKKLAVTIEIGLNHEQQHQELLITDVKNMFSYNPLNPVYAELKIDGKSAVENIKWIEFEEGIYEIGHNDNSFFYDNEKPNHKHYLHNFALADRLVTNGEYIKFIEDGGYENQVLWLSDGFAEVQKNKWNAPLYWHKKDGEWWNYTLNGMRKVNPDEPVCHVSFFEAEAFAHWSGFRLPTEQEWETASRGLTYQGNFVENEKFHPVPLEENPPGLKQMFGDVWEWTRSDYAPYPGYRIPPGAIGEYNGKFMSNQIVLRGGSCATSKSHIRNTYRNFFYPPQRWQFMGIRLAKDV